MFMLFFKLVKNSLEEDGGREMEEKKRKEKEKEEGMKGIVRRGIKNNNNSRNY